MQWEFDITEVSKMLIWGLILPILCNLNLRARLLCSWNSPDKNTGEGCHSLLQGIFPTQGLNLNLLHCRQILYHLSHQGSPFWKDLKIITAERKIFSTKGLVKWNMHMTKMNLTFTPGIKIHARWNIDLNFRAKIIKLLEENKKKNLSLN